jgi:hypothetical protein
MWIQCCVCKRIRQEGQWIAPDRLGVNGTPVSHGYCPECAARAFEQVRAWKHELKTLKEEKPKLARCSSA